MYKNENTVTLVTTASPLDQNLALNAYEVVGTETLASIHEGYINVIPLLNLDRRCRYVSLCNGSDRGKGLVKQIKWLKVGEEVIFAVASTVGLQIYDVEVYDLKFSHTCEAFRSVPDFVNGLCVVEENLLCVGTSLGTVSLFQYTEQFNFSLIEYFRAHDEPIILLDGKGKYLISCSSKAIFLWFKDKRFEILRQIYVDGLSSTPTVLKVTPYLVLVGYESGEFCVFDLVDWSYVVRTVAHKLKISGIDFCTLSQLILTGSEDAYIKLWTFHDCESEASCVFSVMSEHGPLCGVGFLNDSGTKFCVVSTNSIKINVYIKDTDLNVNV
ncbi:hypothetical protein RN001_011794 [Aquatica leii]|uniref:WD repeat-containing protein 54 beta-propeller domain-containing protein n=1 Tax=Aquatica leii TaxID=1421715 RepID=A0AAN7SD01_9COLE|nr:hypothetical protein RN001_011794 [Aquatica leii]